MKIKIEVKRNNGTHTFNASIQLGMCEVEYNKATYGFAQYGTKITSDFNWNCRKLLLVVIVTTYVMKYLYFLFTDTYLYINKG